jgi:hypothetical protein
VAATRGAFAFRACCERTGSFSALPALGRPAFAHPDNLPCPATAHSESSPVPSARSSGIRSPQALASPQRSLVLSTPSARSSSVRSPWRPAVPGARSFSAILRPRRSLILGPRPFPALVPPAYAPLRCSPVGVYSFLANCLSSAFTRSRRVPFPALASPAFALPQRSPVLAARPYPAELM